MNPRAAIALTATSAALSLAFGACVEEAPNPTAGGLTLRTAAIGTCDGNENRDRQFPSGSDRVVLELSGGGLSTPWYGVAPKTDTTAAGEVVLASVPAGTGYTLRVVACQGTATTWAGETHDVDIVANAKTFPPVFLTPADTLACTGNAQSAPGAAEPSEPRVFAALASDGEDAWLFGGFSTYSVTDGATATQTIDRYVRLDSEFSAAGGLKHARGMALAQPLSDGSVRIFGGARKIRVAQAGKPALYATAADAPESASERYNPTTQVSEVEEAAQLPALPATVAVGDIGLAIGGVEAGGVGNQDQYSRNVTRFAANGASSAELPGPARFGATVVALDGQHVLVWGGNVDADVANLGVVIDASGALDSGLSTLAATGADAVPIFAAGAVVGTDAGGRIPVVIAGGNTIGAGPLFPRDVANPRLDLVLVDLTAGTATVKPIATGALADTFTRAAASLHFVGDGELVWFGGYTAFQSNAICGGGNDCLQDDLLRLKVTGLTGTPAVTVLDPELTLSVGPLGARAVALGDGSWLMTGGIETITQTTLGDEAALVRYGAFEDDLCADHPLPAAPTSL